MRPGRQHRGAFCPGPAVGLEVGGGTLARLGRPVWTLSSGPRGLRAAGGRKWCEGVNRGAGTSLRGKQPPRSKACAEGPLRHPQPQGPGGRAPPLITFLLDDASPGPWWEEVPGGLAAQKAQHPGPHLACGGVSPGDSLLMIVAERGDCPPVPGPVGTWKPPSLAPAAIPPACGTNGSQASAGSCNLAGPWESALRGGWSLGS